MDSLLEVKNLSKSFGSFKAVDDISFSIKPGEVVGFLGPNGAGKSTTMKMVTGFLEPDSGSSIINGFNVRENPLQAKEQLGYLPEGAPAYGEMTPLYMLRFIAKLRQLDKDYAKKRIDHVIDQLQLGDVLKKPIETLSKGFKRRVGIAQSILHDPDLLILDEPTDGLDPNQKFEVRKLLSELSSEKAVIVSTHILEEVEAICSRVILIADGKMVADQTPDQLVQRSRHHNAVTLRVQKTHKDKAIGVLKKLDVVSSIETVEEANDNAKIVAYPAETAELLTSVKQAIEGENIQTSEMFVERGRLDDVFRDLTKVA